MVVGVRSINVGMDGSSPCACLLVMAPVPASLPAAATVDLFLYRKRDQSSGGTEGGEGGGGVGRRKGREYT